MQLKCWDAVEWLELPRIEHPTHACYLLERLINVNGFGVNRVQGLPEVLWSDTQWTRNGTLDEHGRSMLMRRVANGEVFLIHGIGLEPAFPLLRRGTGAESDKWQVADDTLDHFVCDKVDWMLSRAAQTKVTWAPIVVPKEISNERVPVEKVAPKQNWLGVDVLGKVASSDAPLPLQGTVVAIDDNGKESPLVTLKTEKITGVDRTTGYNRLSLKSAQLALKHGNLLIPLGFDKIESSPHKPSGAVKHTILAPLLLRRYTTPEHLLKDGDFLGAGSYVYIFMDGYLWRELKVVDGGSFQEIDLAKWYGYEQREPVANSLTYITIPVKLGGRTPKIEIALAPVQWSWARIMAFGGLHDRDPRNKHNYSKQVNKVDGEKRSSRLKILEVEKLESNNWPSPWCKSDVFPDRVDLVKYTGRELPVFHIDDPVGIALRLKGEHAATLLETELLSAAMEDSEYPLALLIQDLRVACAERLGSASQNKENYEELIEYELYNGVNAGKLQQSITHWQDLDHELSKTLYYDGKRLLDFMIDDKPSLKFHTVMEDYFDHGTPESFALGSALWCSLIEGLYFSEARDYIKQVADGKFIIGAYLTKPTPDQARYLIELEKDHSLDDALYPPVELGELEILLASKTSTKVFRYMVNGFALAKLSEPGTAGLKWLIDFIQVYLPEFRAQVREVALTALYTVNPASNWHYYRYKPQLQGKQVGGKVRLVPVIVPDGIDLPRSAAQLKAHPLYKQGLIGLWGTIESINLAVALGKSLETGAPRDIAKTSQAMADGVGYVASVVDMATEGRQKRVKKQLAQVKELLDRASQRASQVNNTAGKVKISRVSRLISLRDYLEITNVKLEIAGKASRILGLASSAAATTIGAWDILKHAHEGNRLGVLGGSLNFAGGLSTFVGTAQFNRWSLARKELQAAQAVRTAGAASTASIAGAPEGLLLIMLGSVALAIGETILKYALTPDLLKAVKYGWFGTEPYNWLASPHERPPVKEVKDHSIYKEGLFGHRHAEHMDLEVIYKQPEQFDVELGEIYRCLFQYNAAVGIYREADMAQKRYTGREVVKGSLYFSRFHANKSQIEVELELHYKDSKSVTVVRLPDLLLHEEVQEGALQALHLYYPIPKPGLVSVVMRSTLDVLGDKRFRVPRSGKELEARFNPIIGAYGMVQYRYPNADGTDSHLTDGYETLRTSELADAHAPSVTSPGSNTHGTEKL